MYVSEDEWGMLLKALLSLISAVLAAIAGKFVWDCKKQHKAEKEENKKKEEYQELVQRDSSVPTRRAPFHLNAAGYQTQAFGGYSVPGYSYSLPEHAYYQSSEFSQLEQKRGLYPGLKSGGQYGAATFTPTAPFPLSDMPSAPIHRTTRSDGNCGPLTSQDPDNPYGWDPVRNPLLDVKTAAPFNAQIPPSLLVNGIVTPNDLFFIRNHFPVPKFLLGYLNLNEPGEKCIQLSMRQLELEFKTVTLAATIMCTGNRRGEQHAIKPIKGTIWDHTAISTARWTGVRLCDVLDRYHNTLDLGKCGTTVKHVWFEGLDVNPDQSKVNRQIFGASIPLKRAMDPNTLLAYKMNGADLPPDHGYPLRVVVPGVTGARSVKWLSKIIMSEVESPRYWQQEDYEATPPDVPTAEVDHDACPSIQETPVTSAICIPANGDKISKYLHRVEMSGYAWSGGGRGIIRVDLSADDGKTWHQAKLIHMSVPMDEMFTLTLWKGHLDIPANPKAGQEIKLVCKATDISCNCQPERTEPIWNHRGLLNNNWYRATLTVSE